MRFKTIIGDIILMNVDRNLIVDMNMMLMQSNMISSVVCILHQHIAYIYGHLCMCVYVCVCVCVCVYLTLARAATTICLPNSL